MGTRFDFIFSTKGYQWAKSRTKSDSFKRLLAKYLAGIMNVTQGFAKEMIFPSFSVTGYLCTNDKDVFYQLRSCFPFSWQASGVTLILI